MMLGDGDMKNEEWKSVVGYRGIYKISSSGRVYSEPRKAGFRSVGGNEMKLVCNGTGYLQVTFNSGYSRKKFYIHRLVWLCFVGGIPKGYEIDHIDCDKSNNTLENLQLLTRKDNMKKCLYKNPHIKFNLRQY